MPDIHCPLYQTTDLPDVAQCRSNREGYRLTNGRGFVQCARCGRDLGVKVGEVQEKRKRRRPRKDMGGQGSCSKGFDSPAAGSVPERKGATEKSARGLSRKGTPEPPTKDAQGGTTVSLTSRPGSAGDSRTDKQPPISKGRLDQDRPGDGPHTVTATDRPKDQEGRAHGKDAPRRTIVGKKAWDILTALENTPPKSPPRAPRFSKHPVSWADGDTAYFSASFTWDLPILRAKFQTGNLFTSRIVVGGPAVRLMPHYFDDMPDVSVDLGDHPGVLQMVNPLATRTSIGCIRKCKFCAVPKTEGDLKELDDWPDLPVICDNNLLATSDGHFDRVMDRLEKHREVDFNQGLDARLLTSYHAERVARLKLAKRAVRLALDNLRFSDHWQEALGILLSAGIPKSKISSYALVGFDSGPDEAWERCRFIEAQGIRPLPMWFHELDAMQTNQVTEKQETLGWSDYERRRIMQWFYKHKEAKGALRAPRSPGRPKTRPEGRKGQGEGKAHADGLDLLARLTVALLASVPRERPWFVRVPIPALIRHGGGWPRGKARRAGA